MRITSPRQGAPTLGEGQAGEPAPRPIALSADQRRRSLLPGFRNEAGGGSGRGKRVSYL